MPWRPSSISRRADGRGDREWAWNEGSTAPLVRQVIRYRRYVSRLLGADRSPARDSRRLSVEHREMLGIAPCAPASAGMMCATRTKSGSRRQTDTALKVEIQ